MLLERGTRSSCFRFQGSKLGKITIILIVTKSIYCIERVQYSSYGDTVCVPDLSYLVKLPKEFPLGEEAVSVLAGARVVLSMVKLLKQVISSKSHS